MRASNLPSLPKQRIDEEIATRQVLMWTCTATLRASPCKRHYTQPDYQFVSYGAQRAIVRAIHV